MMSCPQDSGFSDCLVRCNGLSRAGFEEWVFYPGMLFGALEAWWGKGPGDARRGSGCNPG